MEVAIMPNYVEMLRIHEAGFSLRQIAKLVSSGRNTVTRTVNIAQEKGVVVRRNCSMVQ